MQRPLLPVDPAVLSAFDSVIDVHDPMEMDPSSRVSRRLFGENQLCGYLLQDRSILQTTPNDPITVIADRCLGNISIALCADQFAVESYIRDEGIDSYCFTMMLQGKGCLIQEENEVTVSGTDGSVMRLRAGTRALLSAANARRNLWIRAGDLEHALEAMLGDRLRRPLEFRPAIDWTRGLAASLRNQLDFLMHEMARPDGVADNPVALASFTDLILSLILQGIPNNHLEGLDIRQSCAVPAYVRRAEAFMEANAAVAIHMNQVAEAAGCSIRTLEAVFRRFRDTTPLSALRTIRLEGVRAALSHGATGRSVGEVARHYGFTNAGRFTAAYRRRFGEAPVETTRRTYAGRRNSL